MEKIRIGILGTSEIAFRRFLPALAQCPAFEYAGVASRTPEKGKPFADAYGGVIYEGYEALLAEDSIAAVYLPLPPALHYEWGKKALEAGKHLLMEKPFTTDAADTQELLKLAEEKRLAVHENYMFLYHAQLDAIEKLVADGEIGELRLIRAAFGFPKRAQTDFRYSKALGGGALLDCGGYPVRLAARLLGETARVTAARLNQPAGYDVDLYGSATLENESGQVAQISFGMDNSYKCELELWGSEGCLTADRVFTAPAGFAPVITLRTAQGVEQFTLPTDDSFLNSIQVFEQAIKSPELRAEQLAAIEREAVLTQHLAALGRG
ncbi:Gfo/Idh/MocA family protein [Oscillibacter ruminantium]|uniref:Gfo/Idh/MocA family protein n=1 Tax=Oscillibacter ruminantium TaxID=1263547 RepID=UPI0002F34CA1|nr:Gfo/Idh/MocA family oxidoreductase [Oscillibacter ruminantium]